MGEVEAYIKGRASVPKAYRGESVAPCGHPLGLASVVPDTATINRAKVHGLPSDSVMVRLRYDVRCGECGATFKAIKLVQLLDEVYDEMMEQVAKCGCPLVFALCKDETPRALYPPDDIERDYTVRSTRRVVCPLHGPQGVMASVWMLDQGKLLDQIRAT